MLRINLLPIRQLKKRAKARNQIISFITLLIFLLLILGAVGLLQSIKIKSIETSIATLKQEKKKYDPIIAKMQKMAKDKKSLEKKIEIIKKLKRDSAITVHILDEIARKVDSKRMWLKSLKQDGARLSLSGVALDNRTIAQFMDALKESIFISSVNLSNASLAKVSGRDLKSFELACTIISPKETTQDKANKNSQ